MPQNAVHIGEYTRITALLLRLHREGWRRIHLYAFGVIDLTLRRSSFGLHWDLLSVIASISSATLSRS